MPQIVAVPASEVDSPARVAPTRPIGYEAFVESRDAAGLVICAISRENEPNNAVDAHFGDLAARTFRFPSAEMIGSAAAMFPRPAASSTVRRFAPVPGLGLDYINEPIEVLGRKVANVRAVPGAGWTDYLDAAEGPFARVEIAPGLVRVARRDEARSERTRDRLRQAQEDAQTELLDNWAEQIHVPMVWAEFLEPLGPSGARAPITSWSAKSRARMISTICELDLSSIVAGITLPCMVTLTLPGDWLAVTPDAATAARKFDNFARSWSDRWGTPLTCIWKREFQRRGAPHWHIWTVPPVPSSEISEFIQWLSETWTGILFGKKAMAMALDHSPRAKHHYKRDRCDCSEVCKSLGAGTGLDFAEGLRARDPKRLAVYFLKESLGGEGKQYQNGAPVEWEGQPVGRFWGYRGIEKAVARVPLDGDVAVKVLRTIRRWQRAQGITREKRVLRGYAPTTGELKFRTVRRPARVIGNAGWVAVNDGSSFAAELGRYASAVAGDLAVERDLFEPEGRDYQPSDSPVSFIGPIFHVSAAPPTR